MPHYPLLDGLLRNVTAESAPGVFKNQVIPYLVDVWLVDYGRLTASDDIAL